MYGPQAAFLSELFGTKVRYSGVSIGYQLASIVAGGLAPLIAVALLHRIRHRVRGGGVRRGSAALITIIAVATYRRRGKRDLGTDAGVRPGGAAASASPRLT